MFPDKDRLFMVRHGRKRTYEKKQDLICLIKVCGTLFDRQWPGLCGVDPPTLDGAPAPMDVPDDGMTVIETREWRNDAKLGRRRKDLPNQTAAVSRASKRPNPTHPMQE